MGWVYTFRNQTGGTNCYHGAVNHARACARSSQKAILVIYHGRQTGHPRNKTADPRKVSFFVRPDGELNFATIREDGHEWYVEPEGAKGITWGKG